MVYYYAILALQGYCLYHCYRNRSETHWYILIVILPLVGCLIYLFTNVFRRNTLEQAGNEVLHTLDTGKAIRDLEKKVRFSDTFENRVALADALMIKEEYRSAIEHYKNSIERMFSADFHVHSQLVKAHFALEDFEAVERYAQVIKEKGEFRRTEAAWCYGQTLLKTGNVGGAEEILRSFNTPFDHFGQRLELVKFLESSGREQEASELIDELIEEGENMSRQNARKNRVYLRAIKDHKAKRAT